MEDRYPEIDVSILIPVGVRHGRVAALCREYGEGLRVLGVRFESIVVLDGPRADVLPELQQLLNEDPRVSVIELTRPFGEATALMAGFQRARGRIVLTLPAYPQIEAADIPTLVRSLEESDLVIAHRSPRAGNRWESLRRQTFHGVIAYVTGLRFSDLGCGARAMRRRVLEEICLYGDQHRFLPVLADRQGFRVREVPLRQSPLDHNREGYRAHEYVRRALDIFSVFFLVRFTKKPLRFFGMVGATTFGAGVLVTVWLVAQRLFLGHALADRPALLLSSLLIVLGLQLFAIGLLGELIIFTHARELKDYQIDRVVDFSAVPSESTGAAADADASQAREPLSWLPARGTDLQ